jgi:hypothetical protein
MRADSGLCRQGGDSECSFGALKAIYHAVGGELGLMFDDFLRLVDFDMVWRSL